MPDKPRDRTEPIVASRRPANPITLEIFELIAEGEPFSYECWNTYEAAGAVVNLCAWRKAGKIALNVQFKRRGKVIDVSWKPLEDVSDAKP